MYDVERREQLRSWLLQRAEADPAIVGAAVTGSAARGAEDRWSDIDLFLGVRSGHPVGAVLEEWTDAIGAVHHFDIVAGPATYRAFLLADLLEVDLGFAPADAFGPRGPGPFRVVFGEPVPRESLESGSPLVGYSGPPVRPARAARARGRAWEAEHWISGLRDNVITMACTRLGLATHHGKGAYGLPGEIAGPLADALVRGLDRAELERALRVATGAFLDELRRGDPGTAAALEPPLRELADQPYRPDRPEGPC